MHSNASRLLAQKDSSLQALQEIPSKYVSTIDKKITTYQNRVSSKTIKTHTRLSKWENKIKGTLEKLNPEAARSLFGNNQLNFTSLLQKIKQGEVVALQYHQQYDKYRDDLTTNIKYLEKQKDFLASGMLKKIKSAQKIAELNAAESSTDDIRAIKVHRKEARHSSKKAIISAWEKWAEKPYVIPKLSITPKK